MKNPMIFTNRTPKEILKSNKNGILNFQNLYSVYLFNNNPTFKKAITSQNNFIFPDGKILSLFLKTKQIRGPTFTRDFFQNKLNEKQKHFFILPETKHFEELIEKFPKLKNSKVYSPPYFQNIIFSEKEVEKKLKQFKPDFVWIGIGNPKQEILANYLYKKHPTFYFNVGAVIDYLLQRKKEAPLIFRKFGLEWFYRLITDFKYSKGKVWKSLIGLRYLKGVRVE